MTLASGTKLGPYEIVAPLGAGGMGEVYRARDTRLDRTVAIKILPEALRVDPQLRDRFEREARVISQLAHPHICTLHDVGQQGAIYFLVLECLEGGTLAKRLERGPMKAGEALSIATHIADALDRAHRSGIVHRDLKPGNIMLTRDGAKLLDFGLAKLRPTTAAPASALTAADLSGHDAILWALAVAAGVVATILWRAERAVAPPPVVSFVVQPPEGTTFVAFGNGGAAAISPDGRRLAFIAAAADGTDLLWIRSLDQVTATPIPGTDRTAWPFWSPDSRQVAFFADNKLKKVVVPGGAVQVLVDGVDGAGGSWNRDGVIVFATAEGRLARVSVNQGRVSAVGTPRVAEERATSPVFLPDGDRFLYHSIAPGQQSGIYAGSLAGPDRIFV